MATFVGVAAKCFFVERKKCDIALVSGEPARDRIGFDHVPEFRQLRSGRAATLTTLLSLFVFLRPQFADRRGGRSRIKMIETQNTPESLLRCCFFFSSSSKHANTLSPLRKQAYYCFIISGLETLGGIKKKLKFTAGICRRNTS